VIPIPRSDSKKIIVNELTDESKNNIDCISSHTDSSLFMKSEKEKIDSQSTTQY
jgi:hypothetical protein